MRYFYDTCVGKNKNLAGDKNPPRLRLIESSNSVITRRRFDKKIAWRGQNSTAKLLFPLSLSLSPSTSFYSPHSAFVQICLVQRSSIGRVLKTWRGLPELQEMWKEAIKIQYKVLGK